MFHSGQLNNQINKRHERALKLVYKGNSLAPEMMTEVFEIIVPHYSLRSEAIFREKASKLLVMLFKLWDI